MAKILFTICGVGRGHATRSSVIIDALMKNHEILIVSYDDAYEFLEKKYRVERISWFKMLYEKDRYRDFSTILYNIPLLPFVFAINLSKLSKIMKEFRPDIVISDFDVNGIYIAKIFGIPAITISNMHVMDYVKPVLTLPGKISFIFTQGFMLKSFAFADYFIIMHLIKPEAKKKNVYFFYPIVRENVTNLKPKDEGYFFVYSSAIQLQTLVPLLEKFPDKKFLVVGAEGDKRENMEFVKVLDDDKFANKLANCIAFISHGGMSSMSEALMLGKPVYTFTSKKFYERHYNGKIAEGLGVGLVEETPTFEGLSRFFSNIPVYKQAIKKAKLTHENEKIIKKIEEIILYEKRRR